jgi:hypothetical protein
LDALREAQQIRRLPFGSIKDFLQTINVNLLGAVFSKRNVLRARGPRGRLIMSRMSSVLVLNGKTIPAIAIAAGLVAALSGWAMAAQDRYTLKLGKLSFSDFKGYENWKDVAVSQTETQMKVIVANDVMMSAYRQGLPAAGKIFPEGSKIVKIEWSFKKNPVSPYAVNVPDTLKAVDVIEKDTKRFPNTHGWAYGDFNYDAASDTFTPQGTDAECGYACHTKVSAQDYIFTAYPKR